MMFSSALPMFKTAILFLCCCAVVVFSSDIDRELIEECCSLGSNWALSPSRRAPCRAFPEQSLPSDIIRDGGKKESCLSIVSICCGQTLRSEQCNTGVEVAITESSCSSIRVQNGNTEIYTHQKECCECCNLGTTAALSNQNCDLFESYGRICEKSSECCDVFYSCCNTTQSGPDSTAIEQATTVVTILAPTTPTTRRLNPTPPVHTPNGICAKFSSALCEHYCHDAPTRPNKFECTCRAGFQLSPNQRNCVEALRVNECAEGLDNCETSQLCVDTEDGFTCVDTECPADQTLDVNTNTCVRRSTRTPDCGRNEIYDEATAACVASAGTTCSQGYAYNAVNRRCEDVDECAAGRNSCESWQRCENLAGSYVCRRRLGCGTGYSLQEQTQTCTDIDECERRIHNCGVAFTCHNTLGSFRCEYKVCPVHGQRLNLTSGECEGVSPCNRGFAWVEHSRRCEDINECLLENPCLPSERCNNTIGSFHCIPLSTRTLSCYNGFEMQHRSGIAKCQDIDECARGTHNCQSRDHCSNTQGSYTCRCDNGYTLNSVSNICEDLNECRRTVGQFCNPLNSQCINTPGSFHCKCKEGFESTANGRACQDVNECKTPNMCQHTCQNVWGSHQCRCQPGFRLSADKRSCNDINECELAVTRGQLCLGFCENTPGSFRCVCPSGFRLSDNGRECLDIDECDDGISGCDGANAICVNTRGGFKCNNIQCPRYFAPTSNSISRSSIRCARQTFVCSQGDVECLTAPLSLSYNFLTLRASRIRIPTELFTMRGPASYPRIQFQLDVKEVQKMDVDSIAVTRDHFRLSVDPEEQSVAVVSVVLPIVGIQDIELQLNMNIYNGNGFFGTASATITIYATTDPWE